MKASIVLACLVGIVLGTPSQIPISNVKTVKVPVELAVMSQCPDGIMCETLWDEIYRLEEDKIDLSLIYVAKIDETEPEFGITCRHGPSECAGNIQQLCMAKHSDFETWWRFVQCQNSKGRFSVGVPSVAISCAAEAGVDWSASTVGQCAGIDASGHAEEGKELLRNSARKVAKLDIEKSCTIVINHEKVCIHDDTWKDCQDGHSVKDFVRQIDEAYDKLNRNALWWSG